MGVVSLTSHALVLETILTSSMLSICQCFVHDVEGNSSQVLLIIRLGTVLY